MTVEVGQIYIINGYDERFKVLCIDGDDCFVRWEEGNHGVLEINRILGSCSVADTPQTERSE